MLTGRTHVILLRIRTLLLARCMTCVCFLFFLFTGTLEEISKFLASVPCFPVPSYGATYFNTGLDGDIYIVSKCSVSPYAFPFSLPSTIMV